MYAAAADALPLICPACRRQEGENLSLHTVEVAATYSGSRGAIEDGALTCHNPDCRRRYPILGGVPLLVPDVATLLGSELAPLLALRGAGLAALPAELTRLLVEIGPDDAPLPRLCEHLSIYLDAAWGERATPPRASDGGRALWEKVAGLASRRVERSVELGASVGRASYELARGAQHHVGIDLHAGSLAYARALTAGQPVSFLRRLLGRRYQESALAPPPALANLTFVVGDALDPPLAPGAFGRAVALNLLDAVRSPRQLLAVLDGLLAPGGELVLATPFSWMGNVTTHDDERIHGPEELALRLTRGTGLSGPYAIEETAELPWLLHRDARTSTRYEVFWIRARKSV